ncbi:hypothetical protein BP6252_07043 [Coleophoma cylindrospora]|uniref:Tat pathway signal sequence n=1 Tax=Coleophoma cylindrospora TaxID=1849047 RepID=A0A3D8RGP7_9HELO|nr:hypothetical protein BP6252_07043 [Coleophoma cylindrospora]
MELPAHRRMLTHRDASTAALPAILEDVGDLQAPPVPSRAPGRSNFNDDSNLTPPPAYDSKAPLYRNVSNQPGDEKLAALKNYKQVAKRGGWRRLALVVLLILLFIIALGVGLGIGLNRDKSGKSFAGDSSGSVVMQTPIVNTTFPAGSYYIETYLATANTNCTSNSATWRCYPYMTYAQSHTESTANFTWIIDYIVGNDSYTISSTNNIFSIVFSNQSLELKDAGLATEHYSFQMTTQKAVIPSAALTSANMAATCYFNQTMFNAMLYTKMAKTYSSSSRMASTESKTFAPWPYAARVEQIAQSGPRTPSCLDASGMSLGDFSLSEAGDQCDCLYMNTGT